MTCSELTTGTVPVIVQLRGDAVAGEKAVAEAGGRVTRHLPLINGLAASVPAQGITTLATAGGVRAITLDRQVNVQSGGGRPRPTRSTARWSGPTTRGPTASPAAASRSPCIDTGIADVADLAGRVLPVTDDITGVTSPCVNLSGEAGCGDSYGHGTFIAGIIAGNGAASGGNYKGVAPGANLVSIKVAGRDGSADVSTVIAGIQWAVSFKDRYGIKVLNLSLGTDGTQTYRTDPLNYAVEKAWASGVTVVVAASNRGPGAGTISKPGDDPWVITVGAIDDRGTPGLGDDAVPNFSSRGPTAADGLAKPDVVAPGAHMVSLAGARQRHRQPVPELRRGGVPQRQRDVDGDRSGLRDGRPHAPGQPGHGPRPGQVRPRRDRPRHRHRRPMAVGAGLVDAYAASFAAPAGVANQGLDRSNGLGSLDASRGSARVRLASQVPTVASGLLTAQMGLWRPLRSCTGPWTGSSWYGSSWYGSSWYGSSWYGSSWYGSSWYGSSWYGGFEGSSWYGSSWYGSSWYGAWE